MRLAFMGTPDFAVPVLSELMAAGHEIAAVYTRAPRRAGRGQKSNPSSVHQFAEVNRLEVRTPRNFKSSEVIEGFAALGLDVAIIVAYGVILPQVILDTPRHGCLNLHASLLPRWRGAAPIQRAIMAGDSLTGVQVMRMEAGLDTGAVMLSETAQIRCDDTAATLHDRLSHIAAELGPRALAAPWRRWSVAILPRHRNQRRVWSTPIKSLLKRPILIGQGQLRKLIVIFGGCRPSRVHGLKWVVSASKRYFQG